MSNIVSKITEALDLNDLGLLRQAIEGGEDVNRKLDDDYGNLITPVSVASMLGHVDLLRFLLASGGDPNLLNDDGTTALTWASNSETASVLIENRARVDVEQPSNGRTSVHWAAFRGQLELLKVLIEAGGSVAFARPDFMSNSPLGCAAMAGNLEVVEFLLEAGHDPNASFDIPPSMSPLQWALEEGHSEVVKSLLRAGADRNLARGLSPNPTTTL